jgi:hypothetical protein
MQLPSAYDKKEWIRLQDILFGRNILEIFYSFLAFIFDPLLFTLNHAKQ